MSIYIYQGSMSADTIQGIDYTFINGGEYKLPDNNPKVLRMYRQKSLRLKGGPLPSTDETPEETKTKKGAKK